MAMEFIPRFVEFNDTVEAQNGVEEFFMEIVIFIFEKLNKAVLDKTHLLSSATPDQVTVSLCANI